MQLFDKGFNELESGDICTQPYEASNCVSKSMGFTYVFMNFKKALVQVTRNLVNITIAKGITTTCN